MNGKCFVALAVVLFLAGTAPAGEMDNDRPGPAAKPVTLQSQPATLLSQTVATELDRESPTPSCFFFRPCWGWCRPWGFGFSYFYTYSFFYRPFFPAFAWPYYTGFGFDPYFPLWW